MLILHPNFVRMFYFACDWIPQSDYPWAIAPSLGLLNFPKTQGLLLVQKIWPVSIPDVVRASKEFSIVWTRMPRPTSLKQSTPPLPLCTSFWNCFNFSWQALKASWHHVTSLLCKFTRACHFEKLMAELAWYCSYHGKPLSTSWSTCVRLFGWRVGWR